MLNHFEITFKSIIRDRIFHGIIFSALIFLLIPSVATLSMRQATELSMTLSLSLISFILLLLSLFLGGTHLWRDRERRYTYPVLSWPSSRSAYLVGKFSGIAAFIFLVALLLGGVAVLTVLITAGIYPPERPIVWNLFFLSIFFDACKYILIVAFAFLFSSVATSFFLPVFGSICIYFVGNASQQVHDYINAPATIGISSITKNMATFVYYILPNFSAFDFKINAVYRVPIQVSGVLMTGVYFVVYLCMVISVATLLFEKREMN